MLIVIVPWVELVFVMTASRPLIVKRVKLLAVWSLTCVIAPTATLSPVVANVAIRFEMFVPFGTIAVIDVPLIVAVTFADSTPLWIVRNWKVVMSFAVFGAMFTVTV